MNDFIVLHETDQYDSGQLTESIWSIISIKGVKQHKKYTCVYFTDGTNVTVAEDAIWILNKIASSIIRKDDGSEIVHKRTDDLERRNGQRADQGKGENDKIIQDEKKGC